MKHVEGKPAGEKIGQLEQEEAKKLSGPLDPYRLFEEYQMLAYGALHRYFPHLGADEDMRQLACLGLWKACRKYDPGRGSFSTLVYRSVQKEILAHLRAQCSQKRRVWEVPLDSPGLMRQMPVSCGDIRWVDTDGFYKALGRDRYRSIVALRQAGLDNGEIAGRLGISRTTVARDLVTIRKIFDAYI